MKSWSKHSSMCPLIDWQKKVGEVARLATLKCVSEKRVYDSMRKSNSQLSTANFTIIGCSRVATLRLLRRHYTPLTCRSCDLTYLLQSVNERPRATTLSPTFRLLEHWGTENFLFLFSLKICANSELLYCKLFRKYKVAYLKTTITSMSGHVLLIFDYLNIVVK